MIDRTTTLAALALLAAVLPAPALAQTFVPDPVERTAFDLQVEKPLFEDASSLAGYSSILEADALIPLGSGALRIGLPLAFGGADYLDGTSVYMGNVRATLLFGEPGRLTSYLGVTLPTASNVSGPDFAVLIGALPWTGEWEKWADDSFSVGGGFLPSWRLSGAARMGLRIGGAAIVTTGLDNMNVDLRPAVWVRVATGAAELRTELATTYMLTNDDGFAEQTTAYLDLGLTLSQVRFRPGVFVRVPLDGDTREFHQASVGLSLGF